MAPDWIDSTVFLPITLRGLDQLDPAQRRGPREERSSEISMPGTMAPPRYSPAAEIASKVVAVPKSTTMVGPPYRSIGADGVGDPVGADLLRVVVEDRHPGRTPARR